jgi:acyl homoserine lactone synthase
MRPDAFAPTLAKLGVDRGTSKAWLRRAFAPIEQETLRAFA